MRLSEMKAVAAGGDHLAEKAEEVLVLGSEKTSTKVYQFFLDQNH